MIFKSHDRHLKKITLKNNIADFKMKEHEKPKEVNVDMPIINYKRRNKRRSLSEIEESVGD